MFKVDNLLWYNCTKCKSKIDYYLLWNSEENKSYYQKLLLKNKIIDEKYYQSVDIDTLAHFKIVYSLNCNNCNNEAEIIRIIIRGKNKNNKLSPVYNSIYSREMKLNGSLFNILKGIQIRDIFETILGIWGIKNGKIYFISPFISKIHWLRLAYLTKLLNYIKNDAEINLTVITRDKSFDVDNKHSDTGFMSLDKRIAIIRNEILERKISILSKYYENANEIDRIKHFVTSETFDEFIDIVNIYVIESTNFHAKFYGATFDDGSAEVINTSFNFISSELNQLETFSFVRTSEKALTQNVESFLNISSAYDIKSEKEIKLEDKRIKGKSIIKIKQSKRK